MINHTLFKICNSSFWNDCSGLVISIITCVFILGYLIIRPPSPNKDPIGLQEKLLATVWGIKDMSRYRAGIRIWPAIITAVAIVLASITLVSCFIKYAKFDSPEHRPQSNSQ